MESGVKKFCYNIFLKGGDVKKILQLMIILLLASLHLKADDDLLIQAMKLNASAKIQEIKACLLSYYSKNYKYPSSLRELIDIKCIDTIPKLTLNDNKWKGKNKNTYKIDPTPNTLITEEDIDETTTWIYNNVFGDIKINKKNLLDINDFFNTYYEMITKDTYKISIEEKIKYANRATDLLNLEKSKTKETADLYIKKAKEMLNKGQSDKAFENYSTALKVTEDFNNKLINLYKTKISFYISKKQYDKAWQEYEKLIETMIK